jgi:hypothetical protein
VLTCTSPSFCASPEATRNLSKRRIHLTHSWGRLKAKVSGIETWNDAAAGCTLTRSVGRAASPAPDSVDISEQFLLPLPPCSSVYLAWTVAREYAAFTRVV